MKLDLEKIKKLAESVKKNELSEITVEVEGIKVTLKKEEPKQEVMLSKTIEPQIIRSMENMIEDAQEEIVKEEAVSGEKVLSPMVGNFYSAPSPGAAPFVKKGDKVSVGDVLCIVEAMKMMNEVKTQVSGTILDICVSDGETVKKGDTLFIIG